MKRCFKAVSGQDRDAWLEVRRKYVTASEAGCITGTNPFKTAIQLWNDKKQGTRFEDNEHTLRGKKHEPDVLKAWSSQHDDAPYRQLSDLLVSVKYPFLAATLDGVSRYQGRTIVLEAKCPKKPWGKKGCPKYYVSQIMVQMLVSGIHQAVVLEGHGHSDYTSCTEHHFSLTNYAQSDIDGFISKLKAFHDLLQLDELPF